MSQTGNEQKNEYDRTNSRGGMVISVLCRIIGIFLIVIVIAFAAALVIPKAYGLDMYNIRSENLAIDMPAGSIAYVRLTETADIKTGDIIVYDRKIDEDVHDPLGTVAADRVREIDLMHSCFLVGDEDKPVDHDDVKGVVTYHLPLMGQFMDLYTTLPGKLCLIGMALCGALLYVLAGRFN